MDTNMDKHGENDMDSANTSEPETNDTNTANTDDNSVAIPDREAYHRPLKRDPKSGKFLPGTGSRGYLGGRPKGAKDKISTKMIEICSDLVADKGAEILEHLARTDPAAAMAICLKVVPNSEWMQAHTEEREELSGGRDNNVRISVVAAPDRLSDNRSSQQIEDRQRGLESPVERIQRPTEDVVATQDDADEDAAEAERERVRKQNEVLKAHGNLTGRRARSAAPDAIEYPDDEDWV